MASSIMRLSSDSVCLSSVSTESWFSSCDTESHVSVCDSVNESQSVSSSLTCMLRSCDSCLRSALVFCCRPCRWSCIWRRDTVTGWWAPDDGGGIRARGAEGVRAAGEEAFREPALCVVREPMEVVLKHSNALTLVTSNFHPGEKQI